MEKEKDEEIVAPFFFVGYQFDSNLDTISKVMEVVHRKEYDRYVDKGLLPKDIIISQNGKGKVYRR